MHNAAVGRSFGLCCAIGKAMVYPVRRPYLPGKSLEAFVEHFCAEGGGCCGDLWRQAAGMPRNVPTERVLNDCIVLRRGVPLERYNMKPPKPCIVETNYG